MAVDDVSATRRIREAVREAYSAASRQPPGEHAFPVGRAFAESLGYPSDLLARLPATSVDAFSGVSNVSVFANIPTRARILDLGCGAGLDSLIAAVRAGSEGRVVGVDFSAAMLERAHTAAREAGLKNAVFCRADAEALPIKDGSIDVALINGIFNLNPSRDAIFRELARVLRRGGFAYAAELILREPLSPEIRASEANWFA
jgi:arsenite methyltransferase